MKLILLRNQGHSLTGKATFSISASIEVSDAEAENIKKYKLGKTLLYSNMEDRGSGLLGALSRKAMATEFTVDSLVKGKKVECKDVVEMLAIEEIIIDVSKTFKLVLDACATFGGESVIEL